MLFPVFLKILLKPAFHDLSTQIIIFASFILEPVQLKPFKLFVFYYKVQGRR